MPGMPGLYPERCFWPDSPDLRSGGMGTVSNDIRDCDRTEEDRWGEAASVAGTGRCGGDGGRREGPRAGADRPGRVVEAVHEERAGSSSERGDDRAPRP